MPVATSAALAAVSAHQAAIAHQALVVHCRATVPNFDAQRATVAEMKEYAKCVETLYPTEIGAGVIVALKVLFVVAILGSAYAFWKDRQEGGDFGSQIVCGLLGFLLAPMAIASVAAFAFGIRWLFS